MIERSSVFRMQRPEGPQPSRGPADYEVDRARRTTGVPITATAETVSTAAANATEMACSAGARNPVPPEGGAGTSRRDEDSLEGGAAGRDDEIARLEREMAEMSLRLESREEERTRMERLQQGDGGGMRQPEPHDQPGAFLADLGKPSPKLDCKKEGNCFAWSKQFQSWAVTNT